MARRFLTGREQASLLQHTATRRWVHDVDPPADIPRPEVPDDFGHGRWRLDTPRYQTSDYGPEPQSYEWDIAPTDAPASHTYELPVALPGRPDQGIRRVTVHYDPTVTEVFPGDASKGDFTHGLSAKPNSITDFAPPPGLLWRGMSEEEYQAAKERGYFESNGSFNIGDYQRGRTYFSTKPEQAQNYANDFAPWQFAPTFSRPAHIIAIPDRPDVPRGALGEGGKGQTEVGVPGRIPFDSVVQHYVGRPFAIYPGRAGVYQDFSGWAQGGRGSVRSLVRWSPDHPARTARRRLSAGPKVFPVGFNDDQTTCSLCGREELRGTVILGYESGGEYGRFGTGCASKVMSEVNGTPRKITRSDAQRLEMFRRETVMHHVNKARKHLEAGDPVLAQLEISNLRRNPNVLPHRQDELDVIAQVDATGSYRPRGRNFTEAEIREHHRRRVEEGLDEYETSVAPPKGLREAALALRLARQVLADMESMGDTSAQSAAAPAGGGTAMPPTGFEVGTAVGTDAGPNYFPAPSATELMTNTLRSDAVDGMVRSSEGDPYEWGGSGDGTYNNTLNKPSEAHDCSGLAADAFSTYSGQENGRYFPTGDGKQPFVTDSNFGKWGFEPGYQEGYFNIGTNGGSGENGHMTMETDKGLAAESNPSGTHIGPAAKPVQSFPNVYHLPGTGPSSRVPQATGPKSTSDMMLGQ